MSTSIVTRSGSSACTLSSASRPLRAVAATVNSPELSRICVIKRRMNALSSTTRTVRGAPLSAVSPLFGAALEDTISLLQGPDLDAPVFHKKVHAAPVIAPHIFGSDRDATGDERLTSGGDVAVADLNAPGRNEIREHARAAHQLRAYTANVGAESRHFREEHGHRRRCKFGRIGA